MTGSTGEQPPRAPAPSGAAGEVWDGRFAHEVLPGDVHLYTGPSRKFKTAVVKLFLRTDLAPRIASEVAALPFVLRHGTREVPSLRRLSRALEALYGAGLDVQVLKLGEQQVLAFGVEVLGERFLPEAGVLERAVGLLADLILDPALDEAGALRAAAVEQEKEKVRRHIEGLINDKGAYAAERCLEAMCRAEPYGVYEYGALADLPHLDGRVLEVRRRQLLAEAPISIYAAGAVDPGRVRDLVAGAFSFERAGSAPLRGTTPHPPPQPVRELREEVGGLSQSKLCMGFRSDIRLADPGFWSLLLMDGVLGGFPHSKLFRNVREKARLCYDASSALERFKGLMFVFAGIDAGQLARTQEMCLEQLAAIVRGEVSADELENTRLAYRQAYQTLLDSPGRTINLDYMMRLAGRTGAPEDAIAGIEAVRIEDLQAAAVQLRLDTVFCLAPSPESADAADSAEAAGAPESVEAAGEAAGADDGEAPGRK